MRKSTRNLGGVTLLLELLLGFALLSIAVLALFAMIPSGDKAVVRSIRMSQANELARGLLEEQMGKNYSSLVDGERTGNFLDSSVSRNGRNLNLEYLYKVSIPSPDPSRNYRNIHIEVWWLEGADKERHSCVLESSKGEFF